MGVELFLTVMNKQLIESIKKARFIWICGNGGSASTAEHFATDLVKKGYKAIALSANTSIITMLANDYGYDKIYSKQLEVYGTSEDLLITISCSGTSPNIKEAEKMAFIKIGMGFHRFPTFASRVIRNYGILENEHLRLAHEVASKL